MRSFLRKIPSLVVIAVLSIASSVLLAADLPSVNHDALSQPTVSESEILGPAIESADLSFDVQPTMTLASAAPSLALVGNAADPETQADADKVTGLSALPGKLLEGLLQGFSTAPIVSFLLTLAAIGTALLPWTKYLPGWGSKSNWIVGFLGAAAVAVEKLGPQAGALVILLAIFGAWAGYRNSEKRAAGTPEAAARIAELRG